MRKRSAKEYEDRVFPKCGWCREGFDGILSVVNPDGNGKVVLCPGCVKKYKHGYRPTEQPPTGRAEMDGVNAEMKNLSATPKEMEEEENPNEV